ncbi:hypothetical protein RhiirA5_381704 [Rhizophagus irregularis]|uniref:3CxxC-type domain-containing protein n=3 Tax=Rhizophagus irregularis TaxID=588596 RepID=U9UL52_RHIID|nr:hypothetical protein GLOIN_2v462641 [Rhizophagus irregularis DAOM 181602=DAOM 197198]EXX71361.1 hypothetical protein RirG_079200 [Rhizophagus irregularis DAOM 197198w]PKC01466.1 hypothetical protein RhiirA5_381704 [Rhizophagus irregularis]PKC58363.1 hypothetical protein RhiirA1_495868 [Rhizophagus irregularis]PKY26700.1 hypothetical protein RhiirB3_514165 [Rhizophagus irregularis]PKY55468.1 hypothetical protein RhiirA4_504349 [Rhizophagus irregularis]|eukprot:XP_025171635.1 hypothetical protein GLOIN_2v462641 [Rhizophagus irregularis DAOM 181602=DAOM 197198]
MADNPPPPPPNPYVAKRPTDKWRHRGVTYCRVFGQWECEMCGKKWDSGYTWVAIKKYEQNLDVSHFKNKKDRMYQRCSPCNKKNPNKHEAKLVSFKLLENNVKLVKGPGHIRNLCGKCNKGAICDRAKVGLKV